MLQSDQADKLQAASYERVFFGPTDAQDLVRVEIGPRGVLLRPAQVNALFPPITKDEVAMLLGEPRQQISDVFKAARTSPLVEGRVDQDAFFVAVCAGVEAGIFGYAETADGTLMRGRQAELTPDTVRFSGWLIGESVPLPITAEELTQLLPDEDRLAVQDLVDRAETAYGAERVTAERMHDLLTHVVQEKRFGYATDAEAPLQTGVEPISSDGYVGVPDVVPPDTRIIRVQGKINRSELANVIKMAMKIGSLCDEVGITLDLRFEIEGEVKNEHSLQMALRELRQRVAGLVVEGKAN